MQLTISSILVALLAMQGAQAALNEPCYGANNVAGPMKSPYIASPSY